MAPGLYFWSERTRTITNHPSCHYFNDFITHHVLNRHMYKVQTLSRSKEKWLEKLRRLWGLNLQPCAPRDVMSNSSVLPFLPVDSESQYSVWEVGLLEAGAIFEWARVKPGPFKRVSTLTTSAPLLGLKHAANMPSQKKIWIEWLFASIDCYRNSVKSW